MIQITIEPMDTLLFRDSRPFSAGEDTTAEFNFPSPLTFYGAIGNAILNSTGDIDHKKFMDTSFEHSVLGKYDSELTDKNTRLKLKGPLLHRDGEIFFTAPSNLWIHGHENKYVPDIALPLPYDSEYKWDIRKENLKPLRLPKVDHSKPKPLNKYISIEVLFDYLSENLITFPARSEDEFYIREVKYGHEISQDSQTVKEGRFYSATHIRFREKVEGRNHKRTGFIMIAEGIEEKNIQDKIIYLGGERKKAILSISNTKNILPEQPEVLKKIKSSKKFLIYLATPAIFKNGWYMDNIFEHDGAELVGAAVNKPQYISGWRIKENMKGEPRAIKKAVPSGSVYFFEAKSWNDQQFEEIYKKYHFGKSLSDEYPSAGFGIGLIGSW